MFYYFYPTTPNKCIKMIKCFYNKKSSSPESLLTQLLNNCVNVLSSLKSHFKTGEFPKFCKITNIIWLIVLIVHLYIYFPHSLKYLKNVFKSFFTHFLGKIISFLSIILALGQVILLIMQQQISLILLKSTLIMIIMCAVHLQILKSILIRRSSNFITKTLPLWYQLIIGIDRIYLMYSNSSLELISIKFGVPQGATLRSFLF